MSFYFLLSSERVKRSVCGDFSRYLPVTQLFAFFYFIVTARGKLCSLLFVSAILYFFIS